MISASRGTSWLPTGTSPGWGDFHDGVTRVSTSGQHNGELLSDVLGLTQDEIADIEQHGVISTLPAKLS
jgi:hypothetical protein